LMAIRVLELEKRRLASSAVTTPWLCIGALCHDDKSHTENSTNGKMGYF
jgi:hypothetical protein